MKSMIIAALFYLFRLFPICKNKIAVVSYYGRGYGSEGKAISDVILERHAEVDIVWLVNNLEQEFPEGIRSVGYKTIRGIYELATAKVWIDNCRKASYIKKRPGQYYIHTWHGGGPCLKCVEKDAEEFLSKKYISNAKNDSKMADLLVSGSKWRTENMQSSFWYDGEIMECDLMKYSHATNEDQTERKVKDWFCLPEDCRLLLYAPTFRDDKNTDCYAMNYDELVSQLHQTYGGDWRIIVRLHPNVIKFCDFIPYTDVVLNGTEYSQIEDLIVASEFLITDYSGCLFEGFRLKRKVILYALDMEHYLKKERKMYFDISKLPSPLTQSMDELLESLRNFDDCRYEEDRIRFVKEIGFFTDVGPEVIADRIQEVLGL